MLQSEIYFFCRLWQNFTPFSLFCSHILLLGNNFFLSDFLLKVQAGFYGHSKLSTGVNASVSVFFVSLCQPCGELASITVNSDMRRVTQFFLRSASIAIISFFFFFYLLIFIYFFQFLTEPCCLQIHNRNLGFLTPVCCFFVLKIQHWLTLYFEDADIEFNICTIKNI